MLEPPKMFSDARHTSDVLEIESLAKLVYELDIQMDSNLFQTFETLVELAGTKQFLQTFSRFQYYLFNLKFLQTGCYGLGHSIPIQYNSSNGFISNNTTNNTNLYPMFSNVSTMYTTQTPPSPTSPTPISYVDANMNGGINPSINPNMNAGMNVGVDTVISPASAASVTSTAAPLNINGNAVGGMAGMVGHPATPPYGTFPPPPSGDFYSYNSHGPEQAPPHVTNQGPNGVNVNTYQGDLIHTPPNYFNTNPSSFYTGVTTTATTYPNQYNPTSSFGSAGVPNNFMGIPSPFDGNNGNILVTSSDPMAKATEAIVNTESSSSSSITFSSSSSSTTADMDIDYSSTEASVEKKKEEKHVDISSSKSADEEKKDTPESTSEKEEEKNKLESVQSNEEMTKTSNNEKGEEKKDIASKEIKEEEVTTSESKNTNEDDKISTEVKESEEKKDIITTEVKKNESIVVEATTTVTTIATTAPLAIPEMDKNNYPLTSEGLTGINTITSSLPVATTTTVAATAAAVTTTAAPSNSMLKRQDIGMGDMAYQFTPPNADVTTSTASYPGYGYTNMDKMTPSDGTTAFNGACFSGNAMYNRYGMSGDPMSGGMASSYYDNHNSRYDYDPAAMNYSCSYPAAAGTGYSHMNTQPTTPAYVHRHVFNNQIPLHKISHPQQQYHMVKKNSSANSKSSKKNKKKSCIIM